MARAAYKPSKSILADDLMDSFVRLRKQHHHIYSLIADVPLSAFRILVIDESRSKHIEQLCFSEFLKTARSYDPERAFFSVRYRVYLFREQWTMELTDMDRHNAPFNGIDQITCCTLESLDRIIADFEGFLAYFMRESLLDGHPFRLDGYTCRRLKLTHDDVEAFRHMASRLHGRLVKVFADDYLRLGQLLKAPDVS